MDQQPKVAPSHHDKNTVLTKGTAAKIDANVGANVGAAHFNS